VRPVAGFSNLAKKSKATPSLSYTLRLGVRDVNLVEAQYQIGERFKPVMPEYGLGG